MEINENQTSKEFVPTTDFEKELYKGIKTIANSFSNKEESKMFVDAILRDKENQSKQKIDMMEEKINEYRNKRNEERENIKSIKEIKKMFS